MYPSSVLCSYGLGSPAVTSRRSAAGFSFSFPFSFHLKNVVFGGSLVQLILAALSLYLSELRKAPERGFLSDAPVGQIRLAAYLPKCRALAMYHLLVFA